MYFGNYQSVERFAAWERILSLRLLQQLRKNWESEILLISFWTNSSKGNEIKVPGTKDAHAEKSMPPLETKRWPDYHDLYLILFTASSVVAELREVCYTYDLDSVHQFTSSHCSGDAFLKTWEVDLELLRDREHLEMAENMIRGAVAAIFQGKQQVWETFQCQRRIEFRTVNWRR